MKEVATVEPVIDGPALFTAASASASPPREAGPSAYIVKFAASESEEFHLYVPADVSVSVWRTGS